MGLDSALIRVVFKFLPVHSDMAIYMTEIAAGKFFLFHVHT